jgi:hypothetical protein
MLLSDEFLAAMNNEEVFFLALACHYHDLAMAGTEADGRTAQAREQVRRDHAIRIGDMLSKKWAILGFENSHRATVLGEICRGHRPKKNDEGEANWDEHKAVEVLGPGVSIRVRLLSALIYAIDELHLGADRAPERVQDWLNIQNEEDRRHWSRHQAINGPVRRPTSLLFQVNAKTPEFEENLRSQLFRKAFSALRTLRRQAEAEGVTALLPSIEIEWDRQVTWELLLPIVCSDMRPRGPEETVQAIQARFHLFAEKRIALDGLCTELGNSPTDLAAKAGRAVDDAVTNGHLLAARDSSTGYILSSLTANAAVFFERARCADELDLLFVGRYRHSWVQELFESEFGRRYVCDSVFPVVGRTYSVLLTQRPPTDPVRLLLQSCPTAAQLVRDFAPSASNLVKDCLLAQVVLSGALIDIHNDPERLLDGSVREAVGKLTANNAAVASDIRLLEELALLGGFTYEQLSAAVCPSAAERAALLEQAAKSDDLSIHMSQSLPRGAPPGTYLPRLLLASRRAGTPILLTETTDHKFNFHVKGKHELAGRDSDGAMLGVGPPATHPPASFKLPARLEVDITTRTIRLRLGRFSVDSPTAYPLVVTLPRPAPPGQQTRMAFGASVQLPELTVEDWRALEIANQILRTDEARMELILEDVDRQFGVIECAKGADLFPAFPGPGVVGRALQGLDAELPAPVHLLDESLAAIADMTPNDRAAHWLKERNDLSNSRPSFSSIFLRLTNQDGCPFEERFLRFLPFDFFEPTVTCDDASRSQEFVRQWTEGETDFTIISYFASDIHELALQLDKWCERPEGEFPFRFRSGGTPEVVTRSAMTVRFLKSRDRVWYRDRPIIIEIRPVNRKEAYQMEAMYWRSKGDDRRAQLAQEICDRENALNEK